MFIITEQEAEDLLNNAYNIFNSEWGRILFKVLIERFYELHEVCIEAGYGFNTEKVPEKVCRSIIQEILNIK